MMVPEVSVVIPAYRRTECILALLRDVYAQEGVTFEVIVVDDCSPDETASAIREAFPQVNLLVNETNSGPAVSRSRGIREAKAEVIVGFDSDVTVPDRLLLKKALATLQDHPEAAGLAFRPLEPDGVTDDVPRWWHPVEISKYANKKFYSDYFSGTAYAFRRQAALAAGLYPEILYMHYEEVEMAYRILDNGGEILFCPDLTCLHHANPVSRRSEIKVFYKPRNQVLIALRNFPLWRGLRYTIPRLGYGLVKAVVGGHLKDYMRAMKSAIDLAPECLKQRKKLKSATLKRMDLLHKEVRNTPASLAGP